MRSRRCSISTTAGRKAAGFRTRYGGRENLEAIAFLRRFNAEVFGRFPHATTAAEESTAWPMVSRPVHDGGLGFGYKWNMGWMHDTLDYMSKDPIYRKHHHNQITFGLLYAFTENFILPLSHDEVVHGKRSILGRMPGDEWQRFANVRAYYGFMFGHPGKKLMFMGGEFAQEREWQHDHSLDWHLLDKPQHAGRSGAGARPQSALSRVPALHELDCEGAGFEWLVARRRRQQRVRLAAQGQGRARALPGGGQLHAADPSRLSRPGAVRGALARGAQHRRCHLWRQQCRQCGTRDAAADTGGAELRLAVPPLAADLPRSGALTCAFRPARRIRSGRPSTDSGTNFALFSAHAEKVELCLFDAGARGCAHRAAGAKRRCLARARGRHRRRATVWLSRARAV